MNDGGAFEGGGGECVVPGLAQHEPADAEAVGKRIADLALPKCAHIMAVISAGEVVVPRGDTVLKAGDEVLILSSCGEEANLRQTFGVHMEPRQHGAQPA
ncbi:MAG: TrkA C-terminal domain-containing protein [Coriobacteriia bacterium]